MAGQYILPPFLSGIVSQEVYARWLRRKAQAHLKRDRGRGNTSASGTVYRAAIHGAVAGSAGRDAYTGEALDWKLISRYDNVESKKLGRPYKHRFALLPTVDHVGNGMGPANFMICGWRTNDAKHDLELPAFIAVCKAVLRHHGFAVRRAR